MVVSKRSWIFCCILFYYMITLSELSCCISDHQDHNLDYEELMGSGQYKESYRADMIHWGEMKREQDSGFFCRLAIKHATQPVWVWKQPVISRSICLSICLSMAYKFDLMLERCYKYVLNHTCANWISEHTQNFHDQCFTFTWKHNAQSSPKRFFCNSIELT